MVDMWRADDERWETLMSGRTWFGCTPQRVVIKYPMAAQLLAGGDYRGNGQIGHPPGKGAVIIGLGPGSPSRFAHAARSDITPPALKHAAV
jgi:hypothetical protein